MENKNFDANNEILQEAERLKRALDEFDAMSWDRISEIADALKGGTSVISETIAERGAELQSIAQAGALLQSRGKHIGEKPEVEEKADETSEEDESSASRFHVDSKAATSGRMAP